MPPDIQIVDIERRCGHLEPGAYYLSSAGMFSKNAGFHAVTYPFGNGIDENIDCTGVPMRGVATASIAASFTLGQITKQHMIPKYMQRGGNELFQSLKKRVGDWGIVDHVGSVHYKWPNHFTDELFMYGPNRNIPANVVREVAKYLPVPVLFTHSRVPVFRDTGQRDALMDCYAQKSDCFVRQAWHFGPNWERPSWGALRDYDRGDDHFMIPAIALLERWDRERAKLEGDPVWDEVGRIAASIMYEEQPFAISWFFRAIKIVDEKNPISSEDRKAGIIAAHPVKPEEIQNDETTHD